jgi:hypothetical protein
MVPNATLNMVAAAHRLQGSPCPIRPEDLLPGHYALLADLKALSTVAPTPSSRSAAGGELILGPGLSVEARDLRTALLSMSAAAHTGRWTNSRPCPMQEGATPSPAPRVDMKTDFWVNDSASIGSRGPR